jgi:hypothetical protein
MTGGATEEPGVESVPGVGPKTAARLRERGIDDAAGLAAADPSALAGLDGVSPETLAANAAGVATDVTVTVHEDSVAVGRYSDHDDYREDATFARYVVVEAGGETLVAGAPFDREALDERVDGEIDHFVPLRTDRPRDGGGAATETYLRDAWTDLYEDVATVYVPPTDDDPRVDGSGGLADLAERARHHENLRDFRAFESRGTGSDGSDEEDEKARNVFWRQFRAMAERVNVDDPEVGEAGPITLPTDEGSVEVVPTSASGLVVRREADGETRTVSVDFDEFGARNADAYEAAYGETLVDDLDVAVATGASPYWAGELGGTTEAFVALDDGDVDVDGATVLGPDDTPHAVALGPRCAVAGTAPVAADLDRAAFRATGEAELVDAIDEDRDAPAADAGEDRGEGRGEG